VVASGSGKETAEDDEAGDDRGFEQHDAKVRPVHPAAVYRRPLDDFPTNSSREIDTGVMLIWPVVDCAVLRRGHPEPSASR
jgi:hypothetical protein